VRTLWRLSWRIAHRICALPGYRLRMVLRILPRFHVLRVQLVGQRLRLFEIARVQALGELVVNFRRHGARASPRRPVSRSTRARSTANISSVNLVPAARDLSIPRPARTGDEKRGPFADHHCAASACLTPGVRARTFGGGCCNRENLHAGSALCCDRPSGKANVNYNRMPQR
jgi:hypothetical protein